MGPNHGVTCAVSEYGFTHDDVNVTSVSYASVLGTFADNNVEFFTPWYWYTGMWETMHLFSRYAKSTRVQSVSSEEEFVSAYSSVNTANDSMTVILVNRSLNTSKNVNLNLSNFAIANGTYSTKRLNQLPVNETFVSHTNNALQTGTVTVNNNSFNVSLPALSTTAVILKATGVSTSVTEVIDDNLNAKLYPNPVSGQNTFINLSGEKIQDLKIEIYSTLGQLVYSKVYNGISASTIEIPIGNFLPGVYTLNLSSSNKKRWTSRLVKM